MPLTLFSCALLLSFTEGIAQSYPARPIRIIVPFAPGGGVDLMARLIGQKLTEKFGQSVVVDNRTGAGGIIGSELGARAVPDGYTLIMGNNSSHGVNQAVKAKLPYDTVRDFTPISLVATAPHLLVTGSTVPVGSIKEFIALAKDSAGKLNYGSAGVASQTHLSGELFKLVTGIQMTHIPYTGTATAIPALVRGEVQLFFSAAPGTMVHIESGRIKALAITGSQRSPLVPQIPTLAEQGVKAFETGPWYALLGPAGMPSSVIALLNREVVRIVATEDFKQKIFLEGAQSLGSTPEQCGVVIRNEVAKWTKVVKEAQIRFE